MIHHYYKLSSKERGFLGNKMEQEIRILIHPDEKKLPKDFYFSAVCRRFFIELREKYEDDQEIVLRKTRKDITNEMVSKLEKEYGFLEIKLHDEYQFGGCFLND